MVNLDDTSRCPVGPECEGCGRLEELAVLTGDTPVGVLCMTLCDSCEIAGVLPIFTQRRRPPADASTVRTWGEGRPSICWAASGLRPAQHAGSNSPPDPGAMRTAHRRPPLPGLPPGRILIPGHSKLTLSVTELRGK
jgi:hypothetical protein